MMHFINLSNGLTHLPHVRGEYHLIRIESTACEQKLWDRVVMSAPPDLMMAMATGKPSTIHDSSERDRTPRALWQGVPFILYVVDRVWFDGGPKRAIINPRGGTRTENVSRYFEESYRGLGKSTVRYVRYFRQYVTTSEILIQLCDGRSHR